MDKKRIEIIAASIMVFILIVAWMNSKKAVHKRSAPAHVAAAGNIVPAPEATKLNPPQALIKKDESQEAIVEWGRDPFSGKVYTTAGRAQGLGDLRIEGIVWDKKNPLVMINGRVLKIGDSFKGNVVVAIKEDGITLSDGTRDLEIKVGK